MTPDQAPPLPKEPDPTYDFPTLSEKEQQDQSKAQEEAAEKAPEPPQPAPMSAPPEKSKADAKQAALQQQKPVEPPKPVEQMKPVEQQQARPQSQPQDQPAATPQEQEQPVVPTAQPDITSKFGMMFTLPEPGAGGDFDAKATASANIKVEDAAALRAHLKTCSILPKSVSPSDNVRIVLRVAFLPDGRLGKEPLLIEASASEKGPALMQSAMKALASCQPYAMLPANRYNEWRMLDLAFTPKDFKGG
ncbi:cell envelope biogenesis protein TolA [Bradyrhizobium sp. G127]|uniref:cell envelope biogenesis protein TolA n=1 Tax=Bradyrhizobium sp. G127 TaxID=2904800 RepID=UPI0032E02234